MQNDQPEMIYRRCGSCGARVHRNLWAAKQPICPVCNGPLRGQRATATATTTDKAKGGVPMSEHTPGPWATVYSAGRSGGWAYVEGFTFPPFELWDAIDLNRWARFAKWARAYADDVPYLMLDMIYHNVYVPMQERREQAARDMLAGLGVPL